MWTLMVEGLSTGIQYKYKMGRVPWGKLVALKEVWPVSMWCRWQAAETWWTSPMFQNGFRAPEQNLCIET